MVRRGYNGVGEQLGGGVSIRQLPSAQQMHADIKHVHESLCLCECEWLFYLYCPVCLCRVCVYVIMTINARCT